MRRQLKVGDRFILPKGTKVYHKGSEKVLTKAIAGEYDVLYTKMTGGGTGHGPGDVYPDGWEVTAVKAHAPYQGFQIRFFQSGCFTCMIKPEQIELVNQTPRRDTITIAQYRQRMDMVPEGIDRFAEEALKLREDTKLHQYAQLFLMYQQKFQAELARNKIEIG